MNAIREWYWFLLAILVVFTMIVATPFICREQDQQAAERKAAAEDSGPMLEGIEFLKQPLSGPTNTEALQWGKLKRMAAALNMPHAYVLCRKQELRATYKLDE